MRLTFEGPSGAVQHVERDLAQACQQQLAIELVAKGEKSNLAGEPTSFLTLVLHYSADIVVGLLAHYLYDVIVHAKLAIKLGGRDVSRLSEAELKKALEGEQARAKSDTSKQSNR